jgi:citrate synthase
MSGVPRGLDGVVALQTRLSHVDGENGLLIIGGYELEALAGRVTFEAAAHLLWTGHLPSPSESADPGRGDRHHPRSGGAARAADRCAAHGLFDAVARLAQRERHLA